MRYVGRIGLCWSNGLRVPRQTAHPYHLVSCHPYVLLPSSAKKELPGWISPFVLWPVMFNSFHSFRRVKGLETWVCLYHLLSICLRRRKGTRWIGWNSGHCSPYFHHLRLAEPFAAGSFRLVKCLAFDYEVSQQSCGPANMGWCRRQLLQRLPSKIPPIDMLEGSWNRQRIHSQL